VSVRVALGITASIALAAGMATAQDNPAAATAPTGATAWVPPGTAGSPIDGTAFHAQVLLDAAGFSPGVIDGKKGMSLDNAVKGFQKARGLPVTGKLDAATRAALNPAARPSTIMVKLAPEQVGGPFVLPFPKDPEVQAKLPELSYRNMLEKVAEAYHTTPDTIVALNGGDKLIGPGQVLRLPNVIPTTRTYNTHGKDEVASVMQLLNVAAGDIQGDHIIVDKSEGLLRVMDANDKMVAQFPVTTGSSKYPLPIGEWKATTYAFLPPFNYQPDILNNPKTDKDVKLPSGPNGPVGVAWLDLTKEHYGIHGTNEPQTIGRAESSGCVRLTNWDVLRLSQMMKPGFKAVFVA
jgi:lipoprotein-anchoring transpeptidase ErfK/SrfK